MKWISIGILLLSSSHLFAQNKGTIDPIQSCPEFFISYEKKQTEDKKEFYEVSFEEKDRSISTFKLSNIKDFVIVSEDSDPNTKDLNFINQLRRRAKEICSKEVAEGVEQCLEVDEKFTDEFQTLIENVGDIVEKDQQLVCENMPALKELEKEITGLKPDEVMTYKKRMRFYKLFTVKGAKINTGIDSYEPMLKAVFPKDWKKVHEDLKKDPYFQEKIKKDVKITKEMFDDALDAFKACGGKENSDIFVANLINTMGVQYCIAPNYVSVKELEEISKAISKPYKNKELLFWNRSILARLGKKNNKSYDIMLSASKEISNKALTNMIDQNFGEMLSPNQPGKSPEEMKEIRSKEIKRFINGTNSREIKFKEEGKLDDGLIAVKKLNSLNKEDNLGRDILNYTSNIFLPNIMLEIAEKMVPYVVDSQLKKYVISDKKEKTEAEKIKEEAKYNLIKNKVLKDYKACMEKFEDYAFLGEKYKKMSEEERMHRRNWKRIQYCKDNPNAKVCISNDPCTSTNSLKDDQDSSDMQAIQGCLLHSVFRSVETISKNMVSESTKGFNHSPEITKKLQDATWDKIKTCTRNQIATHQATTSRFNKQIPEDITIEGGSVYFELLGQNDVVKALGECADAAQIGTTRDVVKLTLLSKQQFIDGFKQRIKEQQNSPDKSKETIKTNDIFDDQNPALVSIAEDITKNTFDPCYQILIEKNKKDPNFLANPILCQAAIEMETAKRIALDSIEKMFSESKEREKVNEIKRNLNSCIENAKKTAMQDMGTKNLLSNEREAGGYLDTKLDFMNCVRQAMLASAEIMTPELYKAEVAKVSSIKDRSYPLSNEVVDGVKKTARECFDRKLGKNWTDLTSNVTDKGIEDLKKDCFVDVTGYFVPKLIINESKIELNKFVKDGYITFGQTDTVFYLTAEKLKNKYLDIDFNSNGKTPTEKYESVYRNVVERRLREDPNALNKFLEEFAALQMESGATVVSQNLNNKIISKGKTDIEKQKLGMFGNNLSSACLFKIQGKLSEGSSSGSLSLDDIATYLYQGLDYSMKSGEGEYEASLKSLKNQCDNFDNVFKTANDFKTKSEFFRLILKGKIYEEFTRGFKDTLEGILKSERMLIEKDKKLYKIVHLNEKERELKSLTRKYLDDRKIFNGLMFKDDSKILSFASLNLDKLMNNDPQAMEALQNELIKQLFKNNDDGAFSDEFARINIEASVGMEVQDLAPKMVKDYTGEVGKRVGLHDRAVKISGDPKAVKKEFDWRNIDKKTKDDYKAIILQTQLITSYNTNIKKIKQATDIENWKKEVYTTKIKFQLFENNYLDSSEQKKTNYNGHSNPDLELLKRKDRYLTITKKISNLNIYSSDFNQNVSTVASELAIFLINESKYFSNKSKDAITFENINHDLLKDLLVDAIRESFFDKIPISIQSYTYKTDNKTLSTRFQDKIIFGGN